MKVRFSAVEEFLEELCQEVFAVEDQIVRLTLSSQQSREIDILYHLNIVAGFVVRGKLMELKTGWDVMRNAPEHENSATITARAEAMAQEIAIAVQGMHLILRRGVFETES